MEINRKARDRELERKIPGLRPIIRIFAKVKFNDHTLPEDALVDTGAHISVIPFYLWKKLDIQVAAEHRMSGVIPEKTLPVNVGYAKARLVDEKGSMSNEIRFLSYLALTNSITLILGMRELLERFDLHIVFSRNNAYVEEMD